MTKKVGIFSGFLANYDFILFHYTMGGVLTAS